MLHVFFMWSGRLGSLSGLYPFLLIGVGVVSSGMGSVGCASDTTSKPGLVKQPASDDGSSDDDSSSSSSSDDTSTDSDNVLTPQQGTDIAPSPASTSATSPCAASDLTLCFTFEGASVDQATTPPTANTLPIQPSLISNLVYVAGKDGQGAAFGPASALRFNPDAAFDLPAGAATVEAWIKRASAVADAVVFDDDARFSMTINAAGHLWCKSSGGAVVGTNVVPVEQWVHVACVVDAGILHAYVDGVEDGFAAGSVGSSPTSTAAIGGNAPFGDPFVGILDSVRVFHVARTPAQIADAAKP